MPTSIRQAALTDASLLARLIRESFRDVAARFNLTAENCPTHPSNCSENWVESDLAKGKHYFLLEKEGEPCGCIALEQANPDLCYLERLAVLPAFRRRGFGALLVNHVLKEARLRGAERVGAAIIAEHTRLRAWYERFGFIATETKRFPQLPFAVTFMELRL